MPYLYLISSVFLGASASVFGKFFTKRNGECKASTTFYNFFMILSVFICWCLLFATDLSFKAEALIYSAIFGGCYLTANIGLINSLKHGPATLTSLFMGLSLILTTFWGFIFWDAKVTVYVIIGIVLVTVAIILCLYSREKDNKSFSVKWLIYVSVACLGNAGCTIAQRTQQVEHNGQYGSMMMACATGLAAVAYLFIYLKSDRSDSPKMIKMSWWVPIVAGVCNVAQNLVVMLMATSTLSPSLIYPVIAVGSLAVVTVISIFLFKERMHWWQWLGVFIGAVSVVLLSI